MGGFWGVVGGFGLFFGGFGVLGVWVSFGFGLFLVFGVSGLGHTIRSLGFRV